MKALNLNFTMRFYLQKYFIVAGPDLFRMQFKILVLTHRNNICAMIFLF